MRLSDLTTGQEAYIIGISGDGAIKKRINEMGFVRGRKVKAIKSAPLKDPVEYDIMGYKLTIRQKDASMVLIEPKLDVETQKKYMFKDWADEGNLFEDKNNQSDNQANKSINVALVGNPNCGKTTIFNFATNSKERVANYSGVTVAAKEALFEIEGYKINVIDLPGTYSLSSYSPDEMFVTDYLLHKRPDVVINVLDSGNLERNMFLTTQLIDAGLKTVVALNMYDEFLADKGKLDYQKLGRMLGIPFVPTIGKKGIGLNDLFRTVIKAHTNEAETIRSIRIPYGKEINEATASLIENLHQTEKKLRNPSRFIALQLLEGDPTVFDLLSDDNRDRVYKYCKNKRQNIESLLNHDINTEIIHLRYGFIDGALSETLKKKRIERNSTSQKIDRALTHKFLGLPVFFFIIWFIFYCTFKLGEYPMNWIDMGIGWFAGQISTMFPPGILNNLVVDGIIGGVGGVAVFLPNIIILFFLISLLEDSGYMARTAFLMDRVMHTVGLHGKSFIPLLMGFGCNVPAIMATRTIESKRDRIVTMFITPFMSCSARLPVYVLFISAFFPHYESGILFSMYAIGILAALVTAIILNKTIFRKAESPFVMELPPYRLPTIKAVSKHTWFRTLHFLKKMGSVILFASIIIWALGYFPRDNEIIQKYDSKISEVDKKGTLLPEGQKPQSYTALEGEKELLETQKQAELLEQSYISRIGKAVQPVFKPLGFDWRMSVSLLTGIMAKEVVVSSMGILYQAGVNIDETDESLVYKLRQAHHNEKNPRLLFFGFMVFTLLYFPCLGTLMAIKKETSRYKWMFFAGIYPLFFAWGVTYIIYQLGSLL